MIVGGYKLDLYCDNEIDEPYDEKPYDKWGHHFQEFPHTFTDEYGSKCRSEARKKGWLIRRGKALCPKCSGKVTK